MKQVSLAFLTLLLVALGQGQDPCKEDASFNAEIEAIHAGTQTEPSEKLGEYIECFAKTRNIFGEDGKYNVDAILRMFPPEAHEFVKKCLVDSDKTTVMKFIDFTSCMKPPKPADK